MQPDFNQKTKDILAKRAGLLCSNPNHRVLTSGPNSEDDKAVVIGEAAHIYGARPTSPRYKADMTDAARAETTNGIWLCGNCHTEIDRDPKKYHADLLFSWRREHEEYIAGKLGSAGQRIEYKLNATEAEQFSTYPSIVTRIVLDKEDGWHWRLTAELMRHLNKPHLRRLRDLQDGLYTKKIERIEEKEWLAWFDERVEELKGFLSAIPTLFERVTDSLKYQEDGSIDIDEIHHNCLLLRDLVKRVVEYEEDFRFSYVPQLFQQQHSLMQNVVGSQIEAIASIPASMDEVAALAQNGHDGTVEKPHIVTHSIPFSLPDGWVEEINELNDSARDLLEIEQSIEDDEYLLSGSEFQNFELPKKDPSGCTIVLWAAFLLFMLIVFF